MSEKKQSMTVFRSDRHEDVAAMILAGLVVLFVLGYMAFIVPDVQVTAAMDGKVASILVQPGVEVKKGDTIYTLEVVEKKWVNNVMQENTVMKDITVKADGKVLDVPAKVGDKVKKSKNTIIVLNHVKGTLP